MRAEERGVAKMTLEMSRLSEKSLRGSAMVQLHPGEKMLQNGLLVSRAL